MSNATGNRNLWALNTPNGILDLQTGNLRPHRPDDYVTKISGVAPDASCKIPIWDAFLDRIMGGDAELIKSISHFLRENEVGRMRAVGHGQRTAGVVGGFGEIYCRRRGKSDIPQVDRLCDPGRGREAGDRTRECLGKIKL